MNKSELVDAIAADAEITKAAAKKALDSVTSNIANSLKKGDKVALVGFGTFSTSKREERKGVNPRTKEPITIAAKTVAKFKPGTELANAVNH